MAKNQPRNQHYIPRFYLKEFATNETYGKKGKEQVYVYDKVNEKTEPRNIKSIAKENYLYSPKDFDGNRSMSMEYELGEIENILSPIWADFANRSIDLENGNIKKMISLFLSSLLLRHPNNLKKYEKMRNFLYDDILKNNPSDNKKVVFIANGKEEIVDINEFRNPISEYEKSMFFIENIHYFTNEYSEIFIKKKWSIIISEEKEFMTSDNPMIVNNNLTEVFGLRTKGTIILFPISPKRLLRLEDYIDDEPKEVCYCPINKDEYILYNHIIWNSSDKYVISSGNIDDVIDKMYNYLRKKRELG